MPEQDTESVFETREIFSILNEMSKLLKTGIQPEVLVSVMQLCEQGVDPEALSFVLKEIKREAELLSGANKQQVEKTKE